MTIEWKRRIVELIAGILTIIGMIEGSTTRVGASFYCLSQFFWWYLMISRRMWGLFPLNLAMTGVSIWYLIR